MFTIIKSQYKPRIFGLYCLNLMLSFLIIGATITTTTACSDKKEEAVIPPKPEEPTAPDPSGVIILEAADVQDYERFYKPKEFADMDMLRSDSKWSFVRSKQSEHFIVFWEQGFGKDPNASTLPQNMRVDLDDLLTKAETFFKTNVNTLKFAELGKNKSNLDKYKMQIYLIYQEEWLATGAGYDDIIGALWVNPSTCKPVGSTIAHEIGHSFQYQVYADLLASGECQNDFSRGFRYGFGGNGGNGFWEQTAQWQSFQDYPMEAFQSYNFGVYMANCHRHIGNEWQRYASYFIHYYWANKHGIDFIGKLWREAISPEDPLQAYMRINNLNVEQFNAEIYDASTRFITWDIDNIRTNGSQYIGKHSYGMYALKDGTYQVAYANCPSTTGYNAIPLNVPQAGTTITTAFNGLQAGSALADNDPGVCTVNDKPTIVRQYNKGQSERSGWRFGYVALLKSGERIYGDMHQKASEMVSFTVPENTDKLWFVVVGTPNTYVAHAWDEDESNDDQFPYTVRFTNTDILGNISFVGDEKPENTEIDYAISFAASATEYTGASIQISEADVIKLAKAFVLQPSQIKSAIGDKIQFYAVESDGTLNPKTTANGYGHWFDAKGNVCNWGADSMLFSEFTASDFNFTIGQYPAHNKTGDKHTIKQALVYNYETDKTVQATFTFNITIK